mmetsp:Transcript_6426/g.7982  ORF Transcript_6426/g.7982 Transcript_6426/m.7982 type:complete len:138 (+) Transcript_6426:117-530(+)|eukprot:CAMPEP_0203666498 /NCGR_PEP_ID=MMETSP0090-20130426/3519_1 /ASSEMBLY_ACC=CAM_ASM_001088 /TAXON_ID=426623 /ORGANISM="Chaetoceros affinis, Strain CCMP159" /LENGTH=137 /DNA_ID=CAMNT_0050530393 /DNA_START=103 /DNA_END=516 /DNA_ORIENTATION=-
MSEHDNTTSATESTNKPIDEKAVIAKFNNLQSECSTLINKITELEQDRNEHQLVEETLKPLDPKRRAFRLLGGVLVERTVEEVLPSISDNLQNMEKVIETLQSQLKNKNKEMLDWKNKYNIRTAEEADAMRRQMMNA